MSKNNDSSTTPSYGTEFLTTLDLTPETRAYAMSGLLEFIQVGFRATGKEYSIAPHHTQIADTLEQVLLGKHTKVILNVFPRSGKTTLLEYFLAWTIGLYPNSNNLWVSYGQSLATESSTRIREIVSSDWFKCIFPNIELAKDTDAKARFTTINHNKQRGDFVSLGAGGSITGKGAGTKGDTWGGMICLDDPLKPDDSNSELVRENVNKWFFQTLYSRRNDLDRTPIVLIQQRLHESDLSGHLIDNDKENEWLVISLPIIDDNGESIWESDFPIEELRKLQAQAPSVFATQYLQNPVPAEGILFKQEHIQYHTQHTFNDMRTYISTDFAVSHDKGDYTVFSVIGVDKDHNIYLIDMYRARTTPDVWVKELVALVGEYNPVEILVESGVIFNSVENTIKAEMRKESKYATITKTTRTKDKESSAQTFLGLFNEQRFHIPEKFKHKGDLISELVAFPTGKHDDMVDTLALLGLNWRRMINNNIDADIDIDFNIGYY